MVFLYTQKILQLAKKNARFSQLSDSSCFISSSTGAGVYTMAETSRRRVLMPPENRTPESSNQVLYALPFNGYITTEGMPPVKAR
ncbi:hypothetical protein VTK73DRAFT_5893 [Phialemonium thermophilum]|uniref:Uncharacterized protein n=1 Tax=Phialemonium thermophilum TaxID=223376 RepID=A0ABR3XWX2_9PEZI